MVREIVREFGSLSEKESDTTASSEKIPELEKVGGEKASAMFDGGDVPTSEEFGELVGHCVAHYMEEENVGFKEEVRASEGGSSLSKSSDEDSEEQRVGAELADLLSSIDGGEPLTDEELMKISANMESLNEMLEHNSHSEGDVHPANR